MSATCDVSPGTAEISIEGRTYHPRAALGRCRRLLAMPERLHAVCEDDGAGASIDRRTDEVDIGAGRSLTCPTFVLWPSHHLTSNPLASWQAWCASLSGAAVDSGHFLPRNTPMAPLPCSSPSCNRWRPAHDRHITGDEDAHTGEA
jgi:haloacetate dehalogenase